MSARIRIALASASAAALLIIGVVSPASAAPPAGTPNGLPQLSPSQPGTIQECAGLADFSYEATVITSATVVPAGSLSGVAVGEHCRVTGRMNDRIGVDGNNYAIGFEMRLPTDWNGRYLYQANGGLDGSVVTALGTAGSESGLQLGFAVLSSDAGHAGNLGPLFGLDPQARLDYGYQAVGTLTPMAKSLIESAYGRGPDRSYMTGGSNGGRHTMVGAARYADQYDGFLAVAPGFNLPQAAVAQLWGAQQWDTVATSADLSTAFTAAERQLVAQAILDRCDGLDRLVDGMVQDSERCQKAFSLEKDVPTCTGDRDGTCLSTDQKAVIARVFAGATKTDGTAIYNSFPFDAGLTQSGWASWKFSAPLTRDSGAVGFIFGTPPDAPTNGPEYALTVDIDRVADAIYQSDGIFTESSMQFMTPPDPTHLDTLRDRGAKLIVVHGASDGVFSPDDTADWYDALDANYGQKADEFARFFEVPGMGHVRGGPATDQYAGLTTLVNWVEYGQAPDRITASVNPANLEVPAEWSSDRSRPLCAYPTVARYVSGDPESADSFACKHSGGGLGG